jgi:hypothetical protein
MKQRTNKYRNERDGAKLPHDTDTQEWRKNSINSFALKLHGEELSASHSDLVICAARHYCAHWVGPEPGKRPRAEGNSQPTYREMKAMRKFHKQSLQ